MNRARNQFFERRSGGLLYMTAGHLTDAGIAHAFTTRYGGVSRGGFGSLNLGFNRGDDRESVLENYGIICGELGVDTGGLVLASQIHGGDIKIAGSADAGSGFVRAAEYRADALITAEPGLTLVVFTADCIPILLYDTETRVAAAVHSGWRGTSLGIARNTAEMMKNRFGCGSILAAIGPGIGPCCFETDFDVPDSFYRVLGSDAGRFIRKNGAKWNVDLKGINKYWLESEGLEDSNIAVCGDCTMCMGEKYWSHRRTGSVRGSQTAIIGMI